MVHPTPGYGTTAGYWQRGRYWSTDQAGDPHRGERRGNNGAPGWGAHTGLDFGAPAGTPILAMTHGKVIAANAYDKAYGYKVILRFDGFDYWYCHMPAGAARVDVGDLVEAGTRIGTVGATGNVSGAHLHVEKRLAGAGFAASSFRDPMSAVLWQPAPIRWESANIGDNNATGIATRKQRRAELLTDLLKPVPDVILLQEAPWKGIYAWMRAELPKRPRGKKHGYRPLFGASGRYALGQGHVDVESHGKVVPAQRGFGRRQQPFTWGVLRLHGYQRRLVVNVHGPFGITTAAKERYWRQVFAHIETLRKRHDLEKWQVAIGGDRNATTAYFKAARAHGYVDAYAVAKKRRYGVGMATTNGWKPRYRRGARIDGWSFHKSVTVLEYRNPAPRPNSRRKGAPAVMDHNRQIAITR